MLCMHARMPAAATGPLTPKAGAWEAWVGGGALGDPGAAAVGADLGKDGFDGAAASLPAEDVERFMRELTVVAAGAQLSSSNAFAAFGADDPLAGLFG